MEGGREQAAAAAAVASLGVAAESLDTSARLAEERRRMLVVLLDLSREGMSRQHTEDKVRWAAMVREGGALVDTCAAELLLLSEIVERRRVSSRDSLIRMKSLSSVGESEQAVLDALRAERKAALRRQFRINRLLQGPLLT